MTSLVTHPIRLLRLVLLLSILVAGSAAGAQGAAADVLQPLPATGGAGATASEEPESLMIEQLGLVSTNDGPAPLADIDDNSTGCTFLSAAIDIASIRRGYEVGYEEYPIVVTLSCDSMEDAAHALNLLETSAVAETAVEPIAIHGEVPR